MQILRREDRGLCHDEDHCALEPERIEDGPVMISCNQATTPLALRSMIVSQSSPRSPRIASPCSLNSGARAGLAASPSYWTGAATSRKEVPLAVWHSWR